MICKPCPNPNKFCWCALHPKNINKVISIETSPNIDIKLKLIKTIIAKQYHIAEEDLNSKSRKGHFVKTRHIAMYVCRRSTNATLDQIGSIFNRKHAVVIHAINKVMKSRDMLDEAKVIIMAIK